MTVHWVAIADGCCLCPAHGACGHASISVPETKAFHLLGFGSSMCFLALEASRPYTCTYGFTLETGRWRDPLVLVWKLQYL